MADALKKAAVSKLIQDDRSKIGGLTVATPNDETSFDEILKAVEELSLDALKALVRAIFTLLISKIL